MLRYALSKGFERSVVAMNVFDVPTAELISSIAEDLEKKFKVKQPEFTLFVKTAQSKERAPQQRNWYYLRLGSLLYRVFKEGPVGVGSLRTYYGGKKNRGRKRHKFRKASGKIIRHGLQQLEELGFIKKEKKGRVITPKGQSYLTKKANELKKKLISEGKLKSPIGSLSIDVAPKAKPKESQGRKEEEKQRAKKEEAKKEKVPEVKKKEKPSKVSAKKEEKKEEKQAKRATKKASEAKKQADKIVPKEKATAKTQAKK